MSTLKAQTTSLEGEKQGKQTSTLLNQEYLHMTTATSLSTNRSRASTNLASVRKKIDECFYVFASRSRVKCLGKSHMLFDFADLMIFKTL